jgi:hypothetical protein
VPFHCAHCRMKTLLQVPALSWAGCDSKGVAGLRYRPHFLHVCSTDMAGGNASSQKRSCVLATYSFILFMIVICSMCSVLDRGTWGQEEQASGELLGGLGARFGLCVSRSKGTVVPGQGLGSYCPTLRVMAGPGFPSLLGQSCSGPVT